MTEQSGESAKPWSGELRRPSRLSRAAQHRRDVSERRAARGSLIEAALIIAVLVAEGFLFARGLPTAADYDEGVYLASVDALRHGQQLGSEIFTSQPPGFYALLTGADVVFGNSLTGVRTAIIALALLGCFGAYLLGRAAAGPAAGLGAAVLIGVAPPFPTMASRISADLPALTVALLALVCFVQACKRRRAARAFAFLAGCLFAAAVSIKLSGLLALVPLAAFGIVSSAKLRHLASAAAGAAAVTVVGLLATWGDLGGIWRGAVTYHREARDAPWPGLAENADRVLQFLDPRTPFGWLVALAVLASLLPWRPRLRLPLWPLWLWAIVSALFLIWHRPLHDNHMVLLAVTLAVPAGTALGAAVASLSGRKAGVAGLALALLVAGGYVQEHRRLERNQGPEQPSVLWAASELRQRTEPGELVVADRPLIAFLADRRIPGELIDTAALRFHSGLITPREIFAVIAERRVRAVVASRAFRDQPAVLAGLAARFPTRIRHGDVTLFLRTRPE